MRVVEFKCDAMGLPFVSAKEMTSMTGGISLINTIPKNNEGLTKWKILESEQAWQAVAMVGHKTEREFISMLCANMIQN